MMPTRAKYVSGKILMLMSIALLMVSGVATATIDLRILAARAAPSELPTPAKEDFILVAEFDYAGQRYQLFEDGRRSHFIPNDENLTLAVADEHGAILYRESVDGHRFGFPHPVVEQCEGESILVLDYHYPTQVYVDGGDRDPPSPFTRVRYRITPQSLEPLSTEFVEPEHHDTPEDVHVAN